MRTVFVLALAACLAWSAGEYMAVDPVNPLHIATIPQNYPYWNELSRDNGDIQNAWCYLNGNGTYAGDQYESSGGFDHLDAIKYFVWSQGWPDTAYQGFSVACWKMVSGTPGDIIWPLDGNPLYNPNTGGNWVTQYTYEYIDLLILAPAGFLVGIGFLYQYPAMDAFGVDNTGVSPYDWSFNNGIWGASPYGVGSARAINWGMDVGPSTLGSLRALYR
jgi:hypothetical protein